MPGGGGCERAGFADGSMFTVLPRPPAAAGRGGACPGARGWLIPALPDIWVVCAACLAGRARGSPPVGSGMPVGNGEVRSWIDGIDGIDGDDTPDVETSDRSSFT